MAIDVVIKQKGLFKKALTEAELSPAGLRTGHWNQAGVLDPGASPDGRVLYDPRQPGRGCYIQAVPGEKNQVALRQALPCTARDLELFYERVEAICRAWKTDRFTQDWEEHRLEDIPRLAALQREDGAELLKAMAQRWQDSGEGILTGAAYPLYLEPETVERLKSGDFDFFQTYLAERQSGDWYYAKPNFYRSDNGVDVLGVYSITEGVESILPLKPFVPPLYSILLQGFSLETEQVTDWRVGLTRVWEEDGEMKGETLGYVPFEQFAQKLELDRLPRFDGKHVFVTVENVSELLHALQGESTEKEKKS